MRIKFEVKFLLYNKQLFLSLKFRDISNFVCNCKIFAYLDKPILFHSHVCANTFNLFRVSTPQRKVRGKLIFLQARELSGNFGHLSRIRELSMNFVITFKFFQKMIRLPLPYFLSPSIFFSLTLLSIYSYHSFSK